MTSFEKELVGSRSFSLIPLNGLSMVISANPRLLLPSKSVLAYARKQNQSAIFEWDEEKERWYWHAGNYPLGWEKKVKVTNISVPSKKAPAKLKSASKSKLATPLPPTGAPLTSKTRGSKRKTTPHPMLAAERRVIIFKKYLLTFLWLTLLTSSLFFLTLFFCSPIFSLQSKQKKDMSTTRPILLDEPESEVHLFSSLPFLFFACASSTTFFVSFSKKKK